MKTQRTGLQTKRSKGDLTISIRRSAPPPADPDRKLQKTKKLRPKTELVETKPQAPVKKRVDVQVFKGADKLTLDRDIAKRLKPRVKDLQKRQKELSEVSSKFQLSVDDISAMINSGQVDRAVGHFQRQMLDTINRIIPLAEKQYKRNPTQSYAYALNALVTQARDLTHDLQATGDRQKLAQTLLMEIMEPQFRLLANTMITEFHAMGKRIEDKVKPSERARVSDITHETARELAVKTQETYRFIGERLQQMLAG